MTIICGYQDERRVWLASDSRCASGTFIFPQEPQKIFRRGAWLFGLSGPSRFAEWMERNQGDFDNIEDVRDSLFEHVRAVAKDSAGEAGDSAHWNVALLAGSRGNLWAIAADGAIWRPAWGFAAIGDGQDYAYGAARALLSHDKTIDPAMLVSAAVKAAICFCTDCGGEIKFEVV